MRYSFRLYSFSCYSLGDAVASRSAVAPLSVLESEAKLMLFFWNKKIYIKKYLIFNNF